MKLITTSKELVAEFVELIEEFDSFYWASAWASINHKAFEKLLAKRKSIRKIVVGIHFYQTHPGFIEPFIDDNSVRFVEQPSGVFHPKIYLFENPRFDWKLIVGSANFTKSAFSKNLEASVLISKHDVNANDVYLRAKKVIDDSWSEGKTFTKEKFDGYKITYKNQQKYLNKISGKYGKSKSGSLANHQISIINKSWRDFVKGVKEEKYHSLQKRIRVLDIARTFFSRVAHFNQLDIDERKFIAGLPNNLKIDGAEEWGYFGSMKGAGEFKKLIRLNNTDISKALDQIPLFGQITRKNYDAYIKLFNKAWPGNKVATATRLLCMKRPDVFLCFDSKNRKALCNDFGISQTMDYDKYWNEIIERIYDSEWWINPNPQTNEEILISNSRAAFLDSIYFEE